MAKPKICKCGHNREIHSKQLFGFEGCDKCHCSDYLRRDRPLLVDKIATYYFIGMIIILWLTFGAIWWMFADLNELGGEEKIDMTFNEFGEVVLIFIFGIFLLLSTLVSNFIFYYFQEKRRTVYPEDE